MSELLENMPLSKIRSYAKILESDLKEKASIVNQQQSKIHTLTSHVETLESHVNSLESHANTLEFQIAQLKRLLFGAKRERFIPENNPHQMTLPFEVEVLEEVPQTEKIEYTREKPKKKHLV